jgi:hypothetical protein
MPEYASQAGEDCRRLRADLPEALAELPPELRDLCLLHLALKPNAARIKAGMAKSTHHRAIARIRAFFERRGIVPL